MRTTVVVSETLLKEAMRVTGIKVKTTAIAMGLQELINKTRTDRLRGLRGKADLIVGVRQARHR